MVAEEAPTTAVAVSAATTLKSPIRWWRRTERCSASIVSATALTTAVATTDAATTAAVATGKRSRTE